MRRRFYQDRETGELIEITEETRVQHHEIMPEIEGYRSMIDGSWISSRAKHREHLRRNHCQELGNDSSLFQGPKPLPDVAPQQRKEIIRAQIANMTQREFDAMRKRDLDNLRWNSRKD